MKKSKRKKKPLTMEVVLQGKPLRLTIPASLADVPIADLMSVFVQIVPNARLNIQVVPAEIDSAFGFVNVGLAAAEGRIDMDTYAQYIMSRHPPKKRKRK